MAARGRLRRRIATKLTTAQIGILTGRSSTSTGICAKVRNLCERVRIRRNRVDDGGTVLSPVSGGNEPRVHRMYMPEVTPSEI